ncbi:MAG TPA: sodium/proton-translocating pyrophosphatase, partial [Thermoanaerobaculia bacterium]|nr:sodium/proton-translocating pyrophosphatase [Thermoanaerobaculia bacterium]
MSYDSALPLVLIFSIGSLFVAWWLARWVLKKDTGTSAMQEISNAIKEGAEAFLRRQNGTIALLALLLAVLIFLLYGFVRSHQSFDPVPTALRLAFWTTLSFVLGASCSVFAGYVGMWISIRSNIRTASAARTSLNDALRISLR